MRPRLFVSTVEPCKETGKPPGKRSSDPPLAKEEELSRENRLGVGGGVELSLLRLPSAFTLSHLLLQMMPRATMSPRVD